MSLESFRCYPTSRTSVDAPVLWITGPNGAGKTSWIEGLSLFSPGKGLRGSPGLDLQNHQSHTPWRVLLSLDTHTGPVCLETKVCNGGRKIFSNGLMLKNQMMMRQWVNMIWPMILSSDAASQRRSYLNRLTFTLDAEYGPLWLRYEKALRQRNLLLQQGCTNALWYDAVELVLSETACLLFQKRASALECIQWAMGGHRTPFPKPQCQIHGSAEECLSMDPSGVDYRHRLAKNRSQDGMQKTTTFGLHKTRFSLLHPHGREWGVCSMGEQKGLLLSLVLALFRVCLKENPHVVHFLLLDEGLTHLDRDRRTWLWDELVALGGYVVVTGTEGSPAPDHVQHWTLPPL